MPNFTLNPSEAVKIGELAAVIDGFTEINHSLSLKSGTSPLEDGTIITDHAVAEPVLLSMSGMVSDLKLGGFRAGIAWSKFRELNKSARIVSVITPWGSYPEMLIKSLSSYQRGAGMQFSINLEEVLRVGVSDSGAGANAMGAAIGREPLVSRGRLITSPL